MERNQQSDSLKVRTDNRQILSIALPITLAIFIPQLNLLINSIFLGHLSKEALGNAGITGIFYMIFAVAGHGLNSSMQSVFSNYAGQDKPDFFKVILGQGIRISIQIASVFMLFTWLLGPLILKQVADPVSYPAEISFLRIRIWGLPFLFLFQMGNSFLISSLNSRLLIIGFVCEAAINVLLDYLLIFGKLGFPELGFNGAAWASVIAELVGMLVVFAVINRTGLQKKFKLLSTFSYNKLISNQIFKVAIPLIFQFVISVSTWFVFFLLIESKGETAKAISNTMRNVFGLAGVFVWAFAGTSNTMISNLIGQGRQNMVIPTLVRISCWSFGLCTIMVSLLNFYPELFFNLFGQDQKFVIEGIPVIRVVSLAMLLMSIANIWLNGITGTGKTKINLIIEIVAILLYLLYTWYVMIFDYSSLAMAWSNEFVYWSAIFIFSFLFLKSNRWKTNEKPDN
jgi:MATE family multidrug resistance protein